MPDAIPLVTKSRAEVLGSIAFHMVVFYVVVKVAVPCVAHERVEEVRKAQIEPRVVFLENAASVNVLVHHERVRARIRHLHHKMQDAMEPGEMVKEPKGRGHRSGEVEDEVGEEDDIGLDADDRLSQAYVGLEKTLQGRLELAQSTEVPSIEDCGLKVWMFRVVERLDCLQRRFIPDRFLGADDCPVGIVCD